MTKNSWNANLLPACSPPLITLKHGVGNSFAFDRVATEPRFNAMKATATPSVGYYSPVYTLTLPTLTGGILPKSGRIWTNARTL